MSREAGRTGGHLLRRSRADDGAAAVAPLGGTQRMIEGKIYELSFNDESDGTKKMIAALPVILLALQEGRLVIIDELLSLIHILIKGMCSM